MIIQGDCIEELKKLKQNSVDAIVTDPPYGLSFMGKKWDKFNDSEEQTHKIYKKGILPTQGKSRAPWLTDKFKEENSNLQIFCASWAKECLRVLKPGGFLLSFGGTRTYHRLVCGIEDAGFEIRDTIMWLYGSGFPKSLNIGKQIDKMGAKDVSWFGKWLREWREKNNITQREIAKLFPSKTGGLTGCVANWELGLNIPTPEQFTKICRTFDLPFESIEEAEREVIEKRRVQRNSSSWETDKGMLAIGEQNFDKTIPATKEAKEWEGWGTALKPACEPIVVARKPLSEKNVALNVLKWGTGGINIDVTRIGNEVRFSQPATSGFANTPEEYINKLPMPKGVGIFLKQAREKLNLNSNDVAKHFPSKTGGVTGCIWNWENEINRPLPKQWEKLKEVLNFDNTYDEEMINPKFEITKNEYKGKEIQGRFPANIILDEEAGQMLDESVHYTVQKKGKSVHHIVHNGPSRFFYCAKASKSERNLGCEDLEEKKQDTTRKEENPGGDNPRNRGVNLRKNNHPTVKPIKLMEYLIKLVSREGATVLDPFLGSGTTGIACVKLNRMFIGIEKEEEYIQIAKARIKPFRNQQKLE